MPTGFIRYGVPNLAWRKSLSFDATKAYTIYDKAGRPIGLVTRVSPTHRREVERRRHLNAFDAGRTVDWSFRPEEYSLRIEGVMLYPFGYKSPDGSKTATGNLTDRILGNTWDSSDVTAQRIFEALAIQKEPFDLKEERIHPGYMEWSSTSSAINYTEASYSGPIVVKWYLDCVMTNWSGEYSVERAVVMETVEVQVANVRYEYASGQYEWPDVSLDSRGR